MREGIPNPSAPTPPSVSNSSTTSSSVASKSACEEAGLGRSQLRTTVPSGSTIPASTFVPPRSTPMTRAPSTLRATINRRMTPTGGDKPYRVYRGGRVKGKVPSLSREGRLGGPGRDGRFRLRGGRKGPDRAPKRVGAPGKRRWGRWILTTVGVLILLVVIWGVASYFSFRSGVEAANKRLPAPVKKALASQSGWLMGTP